MEIRLHCFPHTRPQVTTKEEDKKRLNVTLNMPCLLQLMEEGQSMAFTGVTGGSCTMNKGERRKGPFPRLRLYYTSNLYIMLILRIK